MRPLNSRLSSLCCKAHWNFNLFLMCYVVCANECVLPPLMSARFGFYKYMKMDEEDDDRPFFFPNPDGS